MNLKELRTSKGLSQQDISKYFNIPLRTYKRIENDSKYESSFKYKEIFDGLKNLKISGGKSSNKRYKIVVAGIGYVGTSLGVMFATSNDVTMIDIDKSKIDLINKRISPLKDDLITDYLANKKLSIKATNDVNEYQNKDIVIISTPTDFNEETHSFNCGSVISVLDSVYRVNKDALVVIKSTIPIGFMDEMSQKYKDLEMVFSPEFLREGSALGDNLYPSRIIVGCKKVTKKVEMFAHLLESNAKNLNKTIYMSYKEAESSKLFANAYLAMRVAFFNELDSYAIENDIDAQNIIKGISLDPRIGDFYNNPSFGYGGYCLPKDSKMLSSSFTKIKNHDLIEAIIDSNVSRKQYIADSIIKIARKITDKKENELVIGIYKLSMKKDSDNYRSSSTLDVMNLLIERGIKVLVFDSKYPDSISDFDSFIEMSDLIITNRYDKILKPYKNKIFTRDLYNRD